MANKTAMIIIITIELTIHFVVNLLTIISYYIISLHSFFALFLIIWIFIVQSVFFLFNIINWYSLYLYLAPSSTPSTPQKTFLILFLVQKNKNLLNNNAFCNLITKRFYQSFFLFYFFGWLQSRRNKILFEKY